MWPKSQSVRLAVSYPHLAVYKRQGFHLAFGARFKNGFFQRFLIIVPEQPAQARPDGTMTFRTTVQCSLLGWEWDRAALCAPWAMFAARHAAPADASGGFAAALPDGGKFCPRCGRALRPALGCSSFAQRRLQQGVYVVCCKP